MYDNSARCWIRFGEFCSLNQSENVIRMCGRAPHVGSIHNMHRPGCVSSSELLCVPKRVSIDQVFVAHPSCAPERVAACCCIMEQQCANSLARRLHPSHRHSPRRLISIMRQYAACAPPTSSTLHTRAYPKGLCIPLWGIFQLQHPSLRATVNRWLSLFLTWRRCEKSFNKGNKI